MKLATLVCAISLGCSAAVDAPPSPAASPCAEAWKVETCRAVRSDQTAICYDTGRVGPSPGQTNGEWPAYDCAAPDVDNPGSGAPDYWYQWWCCGARACAPGEWTPCQCQGGARGRQVCDGAGVHFGSCVCD